MTSRTCVTRGITLAIAFVLCAPVGAGAQAPTFQIVFQSDRAKNSDLWLVDSNGANERPLTRTATPEASPSWSPDGSTIVYACAPAANWEVCTIDPTTGQVTQLTKTAADEFDPRYTSNGSQIVIETYERGSGNADIAIMPASGGVPKRLNRFRRVRQQPYRGEARCFSRLGAASSVGRVPRPAGRAPSRPTVAHRPHGGASM